MEGESPFYIFLPQWGGDIPLPKYGEGVADIIPHSYPSQQLQKKIKKIIFLFIQVNFLKLIYRVSINYLLKVLCI